MAIVFTSMISSNQKSMTWLAQKSDLVDLRSQLISTLSNATICSCQINPNLTADNSNDANLVFNSNITNGTPLINMIRIRSGCGASDPIVAQAGQKLPNGLVISSVQLANIRPTTSPATTAWTGEFTINFNQDPRSLPVRPVTMNARLTLATPFPSTVQIISACSAASAGGVAIDWIATSGAITSANSFCISAGYAGSTGMCRSSATMRTSSCTNEGGSFGMFVIEEDPNSANLYQMRFQNIGGAGYAIQCFK